MWMRFKYDFWEICQIFFKLLISSSCRSEEEEQICVHVAGTTLSNISRVASSSSEQPYLRLKKKNKKKHAIKNRYF